ncbi:alpha-D-ribose 1-methylphosphonate 5-triphosphate diphosphatase [Pseudooceanicola sediminis]|mgnify:CR=1 FL=1|uniref:Alpha-D-ribose 1-methylphosphonate 5-triphosphate diphosphatase n=1 Tax=Pseudooceanicola sediminis TaxID=2211117 RepID=A0A399IYF9_9RHOB|nr:alpha-D-ribose 1-methylphosphonate 5-triphosphate diphosphatase [Pseudooceanicola sediminis]KAA2312042.1 alpha-D-ribose 1-methylphosphonate 5-triphosphate diphosphatase [Puniceibacterium sp. HSS470]RII38051.1 alpha-D-ribose 1-methylphosphonate 5-triphosphate diphosphatase [Pseudooceanicola sediminis]|tara:strand:- start:40698 stop:41882 length:1185 start_codon:yes stop_codon:yes gene_type:complete
MRQTLPSLRLTGATILRDGALQQRSLAFADGRITRGPLPEVDLTGYLILPGIIDLHGDAFERHISPRPSAPFALETGLRATDRDAAANGVTTAWLAQSWSWEGGTRGPDFAISLMDALAEYRAQTTLTDLRLQIRCETHTVETEARLLDAVRRHRIDYVVFNDHLDEAEHMLSARPEEFHFWAKRLGRTGEAHHAALLAAQRQRREVPRYLCRLAEQFDALGVTYGSHDDPDGETRETYSMIGAKICEFPTARPAAALARAVGDPILMGAPNVVRGGSQAGNIAATELIRAGLCDALVSDYYYPALAQAAFRLADDGVLPLAAAWDMISGRPADILRLHDRGRLDPGLRADMVVIDPSTRAIEATISGGRITHLAGEAAHRFAHAPQRTAIAAE